MTSFIGRSKEISEIQQLLDFSRLITLSGPGGVGKTRLALQVATLLQNDFEHGVWLVELSSLSSLQLLTQEVVKALGLQEVNTRTKLATLSIHLQDKHLLLILDNCEHLVTACAELVEYLLQNCAHLHILTTSREALGISGETIWQVVPLSLPGLHRSLTIKSLNESESGQLFMERAQAVQPGFQVTIKSAMAIAQICHQLDGIPLAIELAATRVKVLTVQQIADRLDDRFRLLTLGSRTALHRHQTLQAAIDWSYDLLTAPEKEVFRRLAAFDGGFILEAAEYVAGDEPGGDSGFNDTILNLLSNLVDKSLITVRQGQEARYHMLETIRQYARGKLLESTELVRIHRRHTRYFLQLAEEAESKLRAANQVIWHKRLEHEQDNFRAALSRSLKNEFVEMGARLAVALITYWDQRGQLSESSGWLERFLAVPNLDDLIRAKILIGAAHFAWQQSNHEQALDLIEQSLALCRRHGDKQGIARSLFLSGVIAHWLGDRDQGANFLEESLSLSREMEDDPHVIDALLFLGDVRLRQGKNELAETIWQEGLTRSRKSGDQWGLAFAQSALGELARRKGDLEHAVSYFQASLNIQVGPGFKVEIPFTLEALAMTVAELGHAKPAAQLWGAAEGLRQDIQAPLPHSYHGEYAPYKDVIKAALGEDVFAEVWADAQTMSLEQAVTLAMSVPVEEAQSPTASTQKSTFGLTPREVEVLRLVATGMTDAQVATELVISPRTVSKHLQSIYSKLALPSRSAATRYAIEHDLL